jgi:hypothetical protein
MGGGKKAEQQQERLKKMEITEIFIFLAYPQKVTHLISQ